MSDLDLKDVFSVRLKVVHLIANLQRDAKGAAVAASLFQVKLLPEMSIKIS